MARVLMIAGTESGVGFHDNALLSYVHPQFGFNSDLAPGFVDACARARR
jgi:hypothetical protein